MELLNKAQKHLKCLEEAATELEQVERQLRSPDVVGEQYVELYEQEFRLTMEISAHFESLNITLDKLRKDDGNEFMVRRLKNKAEEILGGFDEFNC